MITYKVLHGMNLNELESNVDDALADGWVLQGGVSAVHSYDGKVKRYYQAAIKHSLTQEERAQLERQVQEIPVGRTFSTQSQGAGALPLGWLEEVKA